MAKAKKSKSSKVAKKVKEGLTDKEVLKVISDGFINNVNVYRGVLSQAIDKHGHDLEKVREHVKHLDGVSCDNYEPILREIDKYKKVSE